MASVRSVSKRLVMTHFSIAIEIQASLDQVWAVLRDVKRPEKAQTMLNVWRVPGPVSLGESRSRRRVQGAASGGEVTGLDEGKGSKRTAKVQQHRHRADGTTAPAGQR